MTTVARPAQVALAVALLVSGCHASHYVVLEADTPLYRDATGDDVLTHMPRYHHEPLEAEPEAGAPRIALSFGGQTGFAERARVRVFDYLHPALDDGADRARAVRREVRELQLADLGGDWNTSDVEAIRAERILPGMTRTQVEVAWGWPVSVEATAQGGGERWVYRDSQVTAVRRWADNPWATTWGSDPAWVGHHDDARQYPSWVTVRVPLTVERIVEFDADGKVVRVQMRRYLDEAGSS
jgi:outer membrane protein assembly factor BamE (lipoprotein component of BamABCDE complex)